MEEQRWRKHYGAGVPHTLELYLLQTLLNDIAITAR
jgi:hypothetical protein